MAKKSSSSKPAKSKYIQGNVCQKNKIRRTMKNQGLETEQEAIHLIQLNKERSLKNKNKNQVQRMVTITTGDKSQTSSRQKN